MRTAFNIRHDVEPPVDSDEAHRLREELDELARHLDELELRFALLVHKTSRRFFERSH